MNDVYFELLKVKLERSKKDLAGKFDDPADQAILRSVQAMFTEMQNRIATQQELNVTHEKQIETLRQARDLYGLVKKSWRWKIGNNAIDFLLSFLRRRDKKQNAFGKLDALMNSSEWNAWLEKPLVSPYQYALHMSQYMDEARIETDKPVLKDKVSVIVLNRNGKDNLDKLFRSFLEYNTYKNYQFILVDHDSNDGSLDLARSHQDRINILLIPLSENFTYSYSNNLAAAYADGEYLLFLNNDIIFDQDVIGSLVDTLKNDPQTGLVSPVLYYPDAGYHRSEKVQHSGIQFVYRQKNHEGMEIVETSPPQFRMHRFKNSLFFRDTVIPVNRVTTDSGLTRHAALCAAAILCRRDDFALVGGFNENYLYGFEDVDLSLVFRSILKKEAVVLHSAGMIHDESYTRKREGYFKASLKIHNLLTLTHRFGYYIRQNFLRALFSGDKTITDQKPLIAILAAEMDGNHNSCFHNRELISNIIKEKLDWDMNFIEAKNQTFDLKGIDVVLAPDISRHFEIENAKDSLLWIGNNDKGEPVFDFAREYPDIFNDEGETQYPGERFAGIPVRKDDPFRTFLIGLLDERFSVSVKTPLSFGSVDNGKLQDLISNMVSGLQTTGISVKTEAPDAWYASGTISSHAVISFSEGPVYYPQPGQINVLWVSERPSESANTVIGFFDMIVLEDDDDTLSKCLLESGFKGKIITLKKPDEGHSGKESRDTLHHEDMKNILYELKAIHARRLKGCSFMN